MAEQVAEKVTEKMQKEPNSASPRTRNAPKPKAVVAPSSVCIDIRQSCASCFHDVDWAAAQYAYVVPCSATPSNSLCFGAVAVCMHNVASTPSRLAKSACLANFFRLVLRCSPDDLFPTLVLLTGCTQACLDGREQAVVVRLGCASSWRQMCAVLTHLHMCRPRSACRTWTGSVLIDCILRMHGHTLTLLYLLFLLLFFHTVEASDHVQLQCFQESCVFVVQTAGV